MKKNPFITYKDRTYWYAVIGVIVALYLLSFFIIRSIQQHNLAIYLQSQIPIALVLQDHVNDKQIFDFQKELENNKNIQRNSVVYISKNTALEEMNIALYGEKSQWTREQEAEMQQVAQYLDNPLPNLIEFKLEPSQLGQLPELLESLKINPQVADIWYEASLVNKNNIDQPQASPFANMLMLIQGNNIWLIIFAFGMAITAALLFRNTLRWHLLVNKNLISNLALAGAPFSFVKQAYTNMAWRISVLVIVILWLAIFLTVAFLFPNNDTYIQHDISFDYMLLAIVIAILTIVIYVGGTYRSLSKVAYN